MAGTSSPSRRVGDLSVHEAPVSEGFELFDLHNHTHRSYDAINTVADYECAHDAGRFDVIAITDHNRIDGALELRRAASFPVIVGQEIDTADGELIGLFLEEEIPAGLSAVETADRIRAAGALVYLQHPFFRFVRHPIRSETLEDLAVRKLIDVVEIVNGGPFTERANRRALEWARGRGLAMGVGSDAHEPPAIGSAVVALPPGELSPAGLVSRLADGRVVDRRRSSVAILADKLRLRYAPWVRDRVGGKPRRQRLPGTDNSS